MSSQRYELVRLEHELRLRGPRDRPRPLGWERPSLPRPRRPSLRLPRRAPVPILSTHEYLQLEFTVEERR